MANFEVNYRSVCLTRPVHFHVFLPNDFPPQFAGASPHYQRPVKTVFVLHGYTADSGEWLYGSNIVSLAMKYNLALVLPNCDVSFYLDRKGTGFSFGKFIGEELPGYVTKTFGLAAKREDTIIMGESMGGFGALHTALAYPARFGSAIALSSALIVHQVAKMTPDMPDDGMADFAYYQTIFGEPNAVEASEKNPETLVKKLKAAGTPLPDLFMACGTEDFLLEHNRAFHTFLQEENVPVSYHEAPGTHNFEFWNQWTEPALQWALGEKA